MTDPFEPDPALAKLPPDTLVLTPTAIDFVHRVGEVGLQIETEHLGTFVVRLLPDSARVVGRNLIAIADAQPEE